MFRLSCFHTSTLSAKQRKTVQLSSAPLQNTSEGCVQAQVLNSHTFPLVSDLSNTMVDGGSVENSADHATDSCAVEFDEETESKYSNDCDILVRSTSVGIKKSRSLGCFLDLNETGSDNAFEDEVKQSYSDGSHDICSPVVPNVCNDSGISLADQFPEALDSSSFQENFDAANHYSFDIIGDAQEAENIGHVDRSARLSCEDKSGGNTPQTPPVIVKSVSLPIVGSPGCSLQLHLPHSRSAEDLHVLDSRRKVTLNHEETHSLQHHADRNHLACNEHGRDIPIDYSCGNDDIVGSAKDLVIPAGGEAGMENRLARNLSQWDGISSKDFTRKRIEDWVLDLQPCSHLEASSDLSAPESNEVTKYDNSSGVSYARREEGKVNSPEMEAARKYISSLTASATSAQLVNYGFVAIPFVSAFSSLKALNLSGNAIVRITAGALPRGLHVLNLSKNNIASIEGLRDLTRLRVLDLSYNRILRIGHGLASCSSLKELYLAGNKISEVEGLHRLLKLNFLDLRFNKISTTKCLGQLAANYLSLQVISLEGNPAQKNVGDEQLKKYLQGLLPHLAYYNRHATKAGSLKDTAERSSRLGISAHQNDRSLKAEVKNVRKGVASSFHGRRSQPTASSRPSSSRRLPLPLPSSGSRLVTEQNNSHEHTNKLLSLKSDLSSVRKSRSLGNLRDL